MEKKSKRLKSEQIINALSQIQKELLDSREQVSFIYGVLEELCERQHIQSKWQTEIAQKLFFAEPSALEKSVDGENEEYENTEEQAILDEKLSPLEEEETWEDLVENTPSEPSIDEIEEIISTAQEALSQVRNNSPSRREEGIKLVENFMKNERKNKKKKKDGQTLVVIPSIHELH